MSSTSFSWCRVGIFGYCGWRAKAKRERGEEGMRREEIERERRGKKGQGRDESHKEGSGGKGRGRVTGKWKKGR